MNILTKLNLLGLTDRIEFLGKLELDDINDFWDTRLKGYRRLIEEDKMNLDDLYYIVFNAIKYIYDKEDNIENGISKIINLVYKTGLAVDMDREELYHILFTLEGRHYKEESYQINKEDVEVLKGIFYGTKNIAEQFAYGLFDIQIECIKDTYWDNYTVRVLKNNRVLQTKDMGKFIILLKKPDLVNISSKIEVEIDIPDKLKKYGDKCLRKWSK